MMLIESFGIALRSLRANKMRSFLTMLGIIIGVASVITMVAVGAGAQTQVAEQIRSAPKEGMAMGIAMKALAGRPVESEDVKAAIAGLRR